jgi:Flp pilus assembly protein TadD
VLSDAGRHAEAVDAFDEALRHDPGHAPTHGMRGVALARLASFEAAIRLQPRSAGAYNNRGIALRQLGRLDESLAAFDHAIRVQPDFADAHANRGGILRLQGRDEASLAAYDEAIRLRPGHAPSWFNRGFALREMQRLDEAIGNYDRAIALDPGYVEAKWNKAVAMLLAGRYEEGFELFECRWQKDSFTSPRRGFRPPQWTGREAIAGRTILLHTEQGYGDAIQFCRYAPLVAAKGARVVFEVPRALAGLLAPLEGVAAFVERGRKLPAFDFHCPLMSLPRAFGTSLQSIPSPGAYLKADAARVRAWRERLGAASGLRVGLVWSGSPTHKNDQNRSLGLAALAASIPAGIECVSLQKELRGDDRAVLESLPGWRHFGDDLADFTDTAALCSAMDIVISVDTSVAHLAGALGVETWVLLAHAPDWRWLLGREDSPWYHAVRLFRQAAPRDWTPVLARLSAQLSDRRSARRP